MLRAAKDIILAAISLLIGQAVRCHLAKQTSYPPQPACPFHLGKNILGGEPGTGEGADAPYT